MRLYSHWYPSAAFFTFASFAGPPVFIAHEHFHMLGRMNDPGHRTAMMFDQRHVDFAYDNPAEWTGRQFPQFSNFLFIDVDENGVENIVKLERTFADFDHLVYASGGDDKFHFILPHNLISSMDLGCCYRAFLSGANVGHDPSVYAPLCGMAMPGAVHPVTGRRKQLIRANSGRKFWFHETSPEIMRALGQKVFGGDA